MHNSIVYNLPNIKFKTLVSNTIQENVTRLLLLLPTIEIEWKHNNYLYVPQFVPDARICFNPLSSFLPGRQVTGSQASSFDLCRADSFSVFVNVYADDLSINTPNKWCEHLFLRPVGTQTHTIERDLCVFHGRRSIQIYTHTRCTIVAIENEHTVTDARQVYSQSNYDFFYLFIALPKILHSLQCNCTWAMLFQQRLSVRKYIMCMCTNSTFTVDDTFRAKYVETKSSLLLGWCN